MWISLFGLRKPKQPVKLPRFSKFLALYLFSLSWIWIAGTLCVMQPNIHIYNIYKINF